MDNEEIRELLKELKESSDESSAVRSRVVKIHFDTPQEAERRERARRKAAEAARQKALEEEEERRAEEEARREAAEKEAEAVVAEAKAEAAAEFSADLGKDLLSQETGEDDDFVPTWMVHPLYEACPTEKEILIVPEADHARSVKYHPELYWPPVWAFIEKYI